MESHFQGKYEIGSQHHSELNFYDDADPTVQVVSATDSNAYPSTLLRRTIALINTESFEKPIVLDIFKVNANTKSVFDLPFHYQGQFVGASFKYERPNTLRALGKSNGYQHLFLTGIGKLESGSSRLTWLDHNRFYSLSMASSDSDQLLFTRLGANDPDFNLRPEPAFVLRRKGATNTTFVSVIESHGSYNPVTESATNSNTNISDLKIIHDDENYTAVSITELDERVSVFVLSNSDSTASRRHELEIADETVSWTGPYYYFER